MYLAERHNAQPAAATHRGRSRAALTKLPWLRELALVAVIYGAYDAIRLLPGTHLHAADLDGRRVFDFERWLHLDPERALNRWLNGLPTAFPAGASYFYESMHYLVTPLVLVWLYRTAKPSYARARNWLATMTLSGLLVFWLFPVTPPRMLPGSHTVDIVADMHRFGWWGGGGTAPHGLGSFVNEYAAMPSLHVGWALWCGVQLYGHARHRVVRIVGLVYPVLTALVVMATGNHYLLDAVAGVAAAALSWAAVRGVETLRLRRRVTLFVRQCRSHEVGDDRVAGCPRVDVLEVAEVGEGADPGDRDRNAASSR